MTHSTIIETYDEPSDSMIRTGGLVLLTRTLRTGDSTSAWLTPLMALDSLFSDLNGAEVVSSHIEWGSVSSSTMDVSGSAMCVEWSTIRHLGNNLGIDLG